MAPLDKGASLAAIAAVYHFLLYQHLRRRLLRGKGAGPFPRSNTTAPKTNTCWSAGGVCMSERDLSGDATTGSVLC